MLNSGTGSLPSELVLLLPSELKTARAGVAVYKFIAAAVSTMSDAAVAVILEWFQNPDAVLLKNKHMLMAVTQQWKEYRATLVKSNMAQADVICRLSLDKL